MTRAHQEYLLFSLASQVGEYICYGTRAYLLTLHVLTITRAHCAFVCQFRTLVLEAVQETFSVIYSVFFLSMGSFPIGFKSMSLSTPCNQFQSSLCFTAIVSVPTFLLFSSLGPAQVTL